MPMKCKQSLANKSVVDVDLQKIPDLLPPGAIAGHVALSVPVPGACA